MKNNINKTTLGKKRAEGFTIIEVLIVLAIAGLILLIVLLAVPALNRNNRNTARKGDVSRIAGALTNFVSNNDGALPTLPAHVTTIIADAGILGQYRTLAVASVLATAENNRLSIIAAGANTPVALAINGVDQVQIVTGGVCVAAGGGGATNAGATNRNLAIQYTVESGTGGTVTPLCQNI